MKVTGTVYKILDEVQYSETFTKREFILAMADGEYTEYIKFQLVNDKRSLLDDVQEGNHVAVEFSLKGREIIKDDYPPYYFTNLDAWKIEHV